ncbi:hypothetical protein NFI96_026593, partial [Prochilodus magdalenae]
SLMQAYKGVLRFYCSCSAVKMAKNMLLYWCSGSPPCWRVMITLEEKKLQGYTSKLLSFEKKEHKGAEVMALNPRGEVRTCTALWLDSCSDDVLFYEYYIPEGERHESALKRHREALTVELKLWETYLQKMGKGSYLAGKTFSMADVVCFPDIAYLPRFGLNKERYPMLTEYYELVKERPSVKASWPPEWLENPQGQDTIRDL